MQDGWLNVSVDCSTVRLLYVDCVLTIGGCCGKERCGSQIGIISQSNFTKRPHRRRMWTVQSYSPGGANVHPNLIRCFLAPVRIHVPNGISIGSAVFAGLTTVTDRPTDHATPSATMGRIFVRSTATGPDNNNNNNLIYNAHSDDEVSNRMCMQSPDGHTDGLYISE